MCFRNGVRMRIVEFIVGFKLIEIDFFLRSFYLSGVVNLYMWNYEVVNVVLEFDRNCYKN